MADKPASITQQIATLIEAGHEVVSLALGRVGRITRVTPEGWVIVKHHSRGSGATKFDRGDPVELVEVGGRHVVQHPEWAWKKASPSND